MTLLFILFKKNSDAKLHSISRFLNTFKKHSPLFRKNLNNEYINPFFISKIVNILGGYFF